MIRFRHPALLAALVLVLLHPAGGAHALGQAELEELESLLRDLGFDPGAVDGVVDAETVDAIRRYHDFALLPGPPEPTAQLLDELRGVAAAYSALNARSPNAAPAEDKAAVEPVPAPEETAGKTIVPPPAPPPKLTVEIAPEADAGAEVEAAEEVVEPPAVAEQVPAEETVPHEDASPPEATGELPPLAAQPPAEEASPPRAPSPPEVTVEPPQPNAPPVAAPDVAPSETDDDMQARVDAELLRFHHQLADGRLTREDLARQFNTQGRTLLQQAQYDDAILKFSVAIRLDPDFAGAYSNRGTAYRHREETDKAEADFDKARELGFGGFRLKDSRNPLN